MRLFIFFVLFLSFSSSLMATEVTALLRVYTSSCAYYSVTNSDLIIRINGNVEDSNASVHVSYSGIDRTVTDERLTNVDPIDLELKEVEQGAWEATTSKPLHQRSSPRLLDSAVISVEIDDHKVQYNLRFPDRKPCIRSVDDLPDFSEGKLTLVE